MRTLSKSRIKYVQNKRSTHLNDTPNPFKKSPKFSKSSQPNHSPDNRRNRLRITIKKTNCENTLTYPSYFELPWDCPWSILATKGRLYHGGYFKYRNFSVQRNTKNWYTLITLLRPITKFFITCISTPFNQEVKWLFGLKIAADKNRRFKVDVDSLTIEQQGFLKVKNLIAEEIKKSSPQGFCNWRRLFRFSICLSQMTMLKTMIRS